MQSALEAVQQDADMMESAVERCSLTADNTGSLLQEVAQELSAVNVALLPAAKRLLDGLERWGLWYICVVRGEDLNPSSS